MKVMLVLLFGLLTLLGEAQPDVKWYISEGNTNTSSSNIIASTVKLGGIRVPNTSRDERARDDIFVILENGDHYNSRPPADFYPSGREGAIGNFIYTNNSLSLQFPSKIDFLYLTDVYDDDPPPNRVTVTTDDDNEQNTISNEELGTKNILSANHDITIGKDITIIINKDSLLLGSQYVLKFKKIKHFGGEEENIDPVVLKPKDVFYNKFILGLGSAQTSEYETDGEIQFTHTLDDKNYIYIALRPIFDNIEPFLPETDEDIYKVVFELYSLDKLNDNISKKPIPRTAPLLIGTLEEGIYHANDPNNIDAMKICKDENGTKYVQYLLEFENTSETLVSDFSASFKLPSGLDPNYINIIISSVGGVSKFPTITHNKRKVTFTWNGYGITGKGKGKGIVKVAFCAKEKYKDSFDFENGSLLVTEAKTFFEQKMYPLQARDRICNLTPPIKDLSKCERVLENCDECSTHQVSPSPKKNNGKPSKWFKKKKMKKNKG